MHRSSINPQRLLEISEQLTSNDMVARQDQACYGIRYRSKTDFGLHRLAHSQTESPKRIRQAIKVISTNDRLEKQYQFLRSGEVWDASLCDTVVMTSDEETRPLAAGDNQPAQGPLSCGEVPQNRRCRLLRSAYKQTPEP
jgi:hypothetical protein